MVVLIGPVSPYRGGIADTNNAFVKTLQEQGEEVIVFSFSLLYPRLLFPGKSQFSKTDPQNINSSQNLINTLNPFTWWKTAKRINALAPKVVVFRYWTPWLALCYRIIAQRVIAKKIAWIDNALPHERKAADKVLLSAFLEGINEVFCMSDVVAKTLKKHTTKPIHTFFHPINTTLPKPMHKAEALQKLALDDTLKYLLFFGLIRPYKGLDLLIKSLPELRKKEPRARVLVVGEPYESLKKYRVLAASLQVDDLLFFHDRFVPNDDISLWFSACDWVVQPYMSATQSGITPMAIHFSKPTVVTNVGSLASGLSPKTGLISEPNPIALTNTLAHALKNTQKFSAAASFKSIKKEKNWHRFCVKFLELL